MEGINAVIYRHLVGKLNVIHPENQHQNLKSQLLSKWILIVAAYEGFWYAQSTAIQLFSVRAKWGKEGRIQDFFLKILRKFSIFLWMIRWANFNLGSLSAYLNSWTAKLVLLHLGGSLSWLVYLDNIGYKLVSYKLYTIISIGNPG